MNRKTKEYYFEKILYFLKNYGNPVEDGLLLEFSKKGFAFYIATCELKNLDADFGVSELFFTEYNKKNGRRMSRLLKEHSKNSNNSNYRFHLGNVSQSDDHFFTFPLSILDPCLNYLIRAEPELKIKKMLKICVNQNS